MRSLIYLVFSKVNLYHPCFFYFFNNDIMNDVSIDEDNDIVSLDGYLIYLILFADDTVLLEKSPAVLQKLLDKLLLYCNKWNVEVNTDKTKILVFWNGLRAVDSRFNYNDNELEIVNSFVYLGMLLHYIGKF